MKDDFLTRYIIPEGFFFLIINVKSLAVITESARKEAVSLL
jgi:hypothetical protein